MSNTTGNLEGAFFEPEVTRFIKLAQAAGVPLTLVYAARGENGQPVMRVVSNRGTAGVDAAAVYFADDKDSVEDGARALFAATTAAGRFKTGPWNEVGSAIQEVFRANARAVLRAAVKVQLRAAATETEAVSKLVPSS